MKSIVNLDNATLCYHCGEVVTEFAKKHGYDLTGTQDNCLELAHDGIESLSCDVCNDEIDEGDNYYKLTVDDDILDDIADKVGKKIGGCAYCEGEERGHFVHNYNNDPFESSPMEPSEGISVSEYLYDRDVPEELYELMCEHIQCPCGRGRYMADPDNPNSGQFELSDELYTKQDVAEFWGYEYETFCEFSKKYGETLEVEDLLDFKQYINKHPMMAFRHDVGKVIYRTLEKHFAAKAYSKLTPEVGTLYRGRTRKRDSETAYRKDQMWSPPPGLPQHGRYNSVGVPVLYVSDRLESIPYEIHPSHDDVIDIGEFQLHKNELILFDLGSFDPTFQGFFSEVNEETKTVKQAYLLPNYIGNCCSDIGYHGVKYEGVHGDRLKYTNYALFNFKPEVDITVNEVISYAPKFTITLDEIPQFKECSPESYF